MITAVDTCILIDVLEADPVHGPASRDALRRCMHQGALQACEVVWAEVATAYAEKLDKLLDALEKLGVVFSPMDKGSALVAARSWHAYRKSGGGRDRIVADFLIGAHALNHCDRILTRDRGFYRKYFKKLDVLAPEIGSRNKSV